MFKELRKEGPLYFQFSERTGMTQNGELKSHIVEAGDLLLTGFLLKIRLLYIKIISNSFPCQIIIVSCIVAVGTGPRISEVLQA